MKRALIILGVIMFLLGIGSLLVGLPFVHDGRDWLVDRSSEYGPKCESIRIGDPFEKVLDVMGKADDSSKPTGTNKELTYFTGGLKTECGIAFEFRDDLLVRKSCNCKWEPE